MVEILCEKRKNQSVIMPFVGEVNFNNDGIAEVDCTIEDANNLVASVDGVSIVDPEKEAPKVEKTNPSTDTTKDNPILDNGGEAAKENELPSNESLDKANKSNDEGKDLGDEKTDEEIREDLIIKINQAQKTELQEMAKELPVDKKEWAYLNKPELAEYLIKKIVV